MKGSLGVLDSRLFLSRESFVVWDCHTEGYGIFDGKLHFHDFYELSFIYDGKGSYLLNGVEYPACRGLLTLATPSDYHMLSVAEGSRLHYYNIIFREGFLSEGVMGLLYERQAPLALSLEGEAYEVFSQAFLQIFRDYSAEVSEYTPPMTALLVKNGIETLIVRMLSRLSQTATEAAGCEDETIRRALLYIREHYREALTLGEVAEAVSRSAGYFSGYFHEKMKLTFSEYLVRFRLLAAASYLVSSDMPLKEVAYLHGFRSTPYFSSTFKAYFGLSPREYRIRNKS
ncbi:MAG: helix-turn-helix transcriptional regulator [Clostridia bacterium]|nr:helix-turn-helix transcriptional regulator [Clostridia bacterium]